MTTPPTHERPAETDRPTDDRPAEDRPSERTASRRRVLAGVGGALTASVGGCLGGDGRDERSQRESNRLPGTVHRTQFSRVDEEDAYRLTFRRSIGGEWQTMRVDVPTDRYRAARADERSLAGTFEAALDDDTAGALAESLATAMDGAGVTDPLARFRVAVEFVRAMPYVTDADSTGEAGYPRYVVETVVDHEGDCEDYAALVAGVLAAPPFGYDPDLLVLPGHAGVGIDPDALDGSGFPTVAVGGREYVYVDATYEVPFGRLPADHDDGVVAALVDGAWSVGDPDAVVAHVGATVGAHDPVEELGSQ
ncbi:hypothetical protein [Halobaculum limi]|uniref:hypothetical protein n=1 Tax=Halobaculum limi TaxID=3031916 RepID=UPI00240704AA|nr:hypothetical protein [Halobaculum sp. YSMS11]